MVSSRLLASFKKISQTAGIFGVVLGCFVLIGWQFDIPSLKSILPGLATMKANTAIAFVLVGTSLWLRVNEKSNRQVYFAAQACAGFATLLSLLTLGEYISGLNFGIDQLLYQDPQTAEASYPGRMSLTTALNFALLGTALLILDAGTRRNFRPAQFIALIAGAVAAIALLGYLYGVDSLYSVGLYSSMALHTALGSALLSLGILCARPQKGFMEIAVTETVGGIVLRRLMPLTIVILIVLGWLRLRGQQAGFYDTNFGLALMVLLSAASLSVILWINAGRLNRADAERGQAERALSLSEQRSQALLENSWDAIALFGVDGTILYGGPSTSQILGYSLDEFVGRNAFELIHEEDHAFVTECLTLSLQQPGEHIPVYARVHHKNGEWRWLEGVFTNLLDEPSVKAIVNNYHDFTERKRAEETLKASEERFRLIVAAAPSAMISVNREGKIVLVNAKAEELFGYRQDELLGQPVEMLIPQRFRSGHPLHRQGFVAQPTSRPMGAGRDLFGLHKDGREVPIEIGLTPYEGSDGQFTLALIIDITERRLAEAGLQESEEKYRTLFESINQGFCTIEVLFDKDEKPVDYRFLIVNPAFERQTGIPNAVGRRMREIAPLHEEHWFRIYGEIALTGESMRFENPADQLHRYYDVYAWRVGMPEERKVAILFNDITERKRADEKIRKLNEELEQRVIERTAELSQANALLNAMMDNVPDHIFFKDVHSRFLRNSRSQALMMGLNNPAETVGKSDFDFFPHAQLSYEKEQEIIRSGKPLVDMEEQVVWPDGRETWVSTTKMPLFDQAGQSIGTFGISRDITERKRAEAALQKAKLELEAANKELEAFSYSVSHDLRAPLRTIDGFSQALLEDYGKQLPEEAQGYLTRVRSGAQRMAELIDDLLNLSRVTRSLMKSAPVDLSKLAQGIAAELQQTHLERNVNFSITPNLKAQGDPHLLQVVLENFLNNAWKFTSKREQAEIEFGSRDENGETVYFVRDNGAGFDMTYASKLFGAFQRLHAMTEFPGTGVGLATVQRVIHRHGGRVWAEAEVGQGATFFFTLPALERAKPKAVQQEKESFAERVREII